MLNAAQIPTRYVNADLSLFNNFSGNGQKFLAQLRRWQERFTPVGSKGVVITGPVGVGKTYVLAALAKAFAERGFSVRFTDFFQLLGELRSGFSEGKADASQLAPLIGVDVLLIDELGKGRGKDFDKTVLDQLVDGRYKRNKTIIASTNYQLTSRAAAHSYNIDLDRDAQVHSEFSPDSFGSLESRVGVRIFSRLREMGHFMELTGDDMRRMEP
jgi:DNA replication protein DnaC